jgi:integral membrane sensor domain MASE1
MEQGHSLIRKSSGATSPQNIALFALLTLLYFVSAKLGIAHALVQPYGTPVWIPAGGAIAAFVLFGYRVWPALFIGSFLGHVTTIGIMPASFIVPAGATIEGLAGAWLVNKFARGERAFDTAKGVISFVLLACVCTPSMIAVAGFAVNCFKGRTNLNDSAVLMMTWWLSHAIGVLLVAPFLILLFRGSHHRMNVREVIELSVLLLGLFAVCLLVFGPLAPTLNRGQLIRAWLCIPFLLWAAFRFCPLEAAGATLIVFSSAIWGTLHGIGTFASPNRTISVVLLDTFVGVIGTMTLVVAATVVERRKHEMDLLGMHSLLRASVEGKERELAETVQALEIEMAGHAQTKQSLRNSREQSQPLAENADAREKSRKEI